MAFLIVFVTIIAVFVVYYKWRFSYWERKRLPYVKPTFPFGTMENMFYPRRSVGFNFKKQYTELKAQGHKHGGIYNFLTPVYMPIDLDIIKDITKQNFDCFVDRGVYYNEIDDPLSLHIFCLDGDRWRRIRKSVSPAFTSGQMKIMFDTLLECFGPLEEVLDQLIDANAPMDAKETITRFSVDVIGSCAFGLECNSFKNPSSDFRRYGRKMFDRSAYELLKLIFAISNPDIGRFLRLTLTPRDTADFFMRVIKESMDYRERTNYYRKDMFQLFLEIKNKKYEPDEVALTFEELAAQAFVVFIAGFETTSSGITFLLYELALNQDIQQKIRDEIKSVLEKYNNVITYKALSELKYTTQAIEESLRLRPPATQLLRKCTKNYTIPGTNIVIEKGTSVFIPILALQTDPEYFSNPEKFDPDRFSEQNKVNIPPCAYMPFGEGPRMCIGNRFAMMEIKAFLAVLLQKYKFTVNKNTKFPLNVDPLSTVYASKEAIWLDVERVID